MSFLFKKELCIYLTQRKKAQTGGVAEGEVESGSPLSRESGTLFQDPGIMV